MGVISIARHDKPISGEIAPSNLKMVLQNGFIECVMMSIFSSSSSI